MRYWITSLAQTAALAMLACHGALARTPSPDSLMRDPFNRSALQQLQREADAPQAAAATQATPPSDPPSPPAVVLRAVMIGGRRPLVDLGGTILTLGESVNGLRLLEVHQRSAVFDWKGSRVVLSLGQRTGH